MIVALSVYLALSLAVGLAGLLGFILGWRLCASRWYGVLMLAFFPSWLVVVVPLVAWGFYKGRSMRNIGELK